MKTAATFLACIGFAFVVFAAMGAFCAWSINPGKWGADVRVTVAGFTIFIGGIAGCIVNHDERY